MPPPQGTIGPARDRDARAEPAVRPGGVVLPERDVRSKRPPLLGFVLRMDTLRSAVRVVSLLAIDLFAIFAAVLTALCVKAALRDAWDFDASVEQTKEYFPLAYL